MDTLEDLKRLWLHNAQSTGITKPLNKEAMKMIIEPQIKKEQGYIKQYLLAFAFWQILVYAALTYFIIRYRADQEFALCCAVGLITFIPYSIIFHKHINSIRLKALVNADAPLSALEGGLAGRVAYVDSYFSLKRKFDYFGVPVISFVLMAIILEVSPVPHTLAAALITFAITFSIMARTTYVQNKNNFELPLAKLRLVLKDIRNMEAEY